MDDRYENKILLLSLALFNIRHISKLGPSLMAVVHSIKLNVITLNLKLDTKDYRTFKVTWNFQRNEIKTINRY